MASNHLERLKKIDREVQMLKNVIGLLHWDQETYMPSAALEERSEQLAFLEGEVHELLTNKEVGELLAECYQLNNLNKIDLAFIREFQKFYERETKLPKRLVTAVARQASVNHASWIAAKEVSKFSVFRNDLEGPRSWVRLKLETEVGSAIGTEVSLLAGGTTQKRLVMPSRSYLSQVELPITFGLGSLQTIDRIEVRWPNGQMESWVDLEPNRMHTIIQNTGFTAR